jgi:hypothetical protein
MTSKLRRSTVSSMAAAALSAPFADHSTMSSDAISRDLSVCQQGDLNG